MWDRLRKMLIASHVTLSAKIAVLILAIITFYRQDLAIVLMDAWQNETTSYILIIPFLFVYLIYRKRKMLRAVIDFDATSTQKQTKHLPLIAGILLCAAAMMFYWYGSNSFTPLEYHVFTLPILTGGIVLILFNPKTLRQLALPIAFLAFLIPPPSEIVYALGSTLSVFSSHAANSIVNSVGINSTITSDYGNPTIIVTRPGQGTINFTVDIACSGIYSLISFVVMAAFVAFMIRDKTWKKLSILMLGLPLIYLFNIVRVTLILFVGFQFGETVALDAFHLIGGWVLLFVGTLLLLAIAEKGFKTRLFSKLANAPACEDCTTKPGSSTEAFCLRCGRLIRHPKIKLRKEDLVKISAISIAVVLLLSVQSPVFALTESPAQILVQTTEGEKGNTLILPEIPGYDLSFLYRDKDFEQLAKQDLSLTYLYRPIGGVEEYVYVSIEVATTIYNLHRWEACLITWPESLGYQAKVSQLVLKDTQILENPPIVARYFGFQNTKNNQTQLVLYWYETSTIVTNNTGQQEKVKISLISYPETALDIAEHESLLLPFATAIANYWQPMKTWTAVSFFLARNSVWFGVATVTLLAIIVAFSAVRIMGARKANANSYRKLSRPNQLLIAAVTKTEKTTMPTLGAIMAEYQEITGSKFTKTGVLQMILEAEKLGFIEGSIANDTDEPVQVWKSQVALDKLNSKR